MPCALQEFAPHRRMLQCDYYRQAKVWQTRDGSTESLPQKSDCIRIYVFRDLHRPYVTLPCSVTASVSTMSVQPDRLKTHKVRRCPYQAAALGRKTVATVKHVCKILGWIIREVRPHIRLTCTYQDHGSALSHNMQHCPKSYRFCTP